MHTANSRAQNLSEDVGFMWKGKVHFTAHIFHSDSSPCSAYVDANEEQKEMKVYNSFMDSNFIHVELLLYYGTCRYKQVRLYQSSVSMQKNEG
jgi:hypothetical protein